jgi:nickel/cobalt transporter (NicO) family protein
MGQGSLTMRLVCLYSGALEASLNGATAFSFGDNSYPERRGWREIVIEGDGATLTASDAPAIGTSDRLTHYPADLLAIPLGQSTASFTAQPGGPILPALVLPDAQPIGVTGAQPQPAEITQPPAQAQPSEPAPVPAGVTDLGSDVTALFQAPDPTPPVVALGLLVAFGLGALHALSPGHGKTVMAAYLVGSKGTARHAIGLGLTVTVSHTLGVLALGALSLSATAFIPPDRLYPILRVVSGAIVVVIGGYLLISRLRSMWAADKHSHANDHRHDHPDHDHDSHDDRPPGWHEHDGMGHTHLPSNGMGWRGLFALGLSGGMIPSVSALLVLIGSISIGRPVYGVVLTVAFGLGMAAVLVGVGFGLVYARRLVERLPVAAPLRLSQRLPLMTAVIVLLAGVLITGQGLSALG